MTRTSGRALGALVVALALTASACGGDDGATVQGVKLVKKNTLTYCTHLPYPPFESEDQKSGKVVGFDIEMVDLVAKRLGLSVKIFDTPFETMRTGASLNAGKCDIQVGGMTITKDRTRFMDVSVPYFDVTQAVMTKKGAGVRSLADLKTKKLSLGAQAGTTGEDLAKREGFDPRSYDNANAELDGLRTGQAKAILVDDPVARYWLRDPANAGLEIAVNVRTGEQLGYWFRKGHNPELVKLTNQIIQKARADGSYDRFYAKWIGAKPAPGVGS
ncbi:basic amino acid ABC transporter substrate-binding protein [Actinomadura meridiana]|uniref:Basic amino acid ABC transporter substrate-binding protein n=1 Tax=Actinomadura meridiana TaxID=559626 RepID=A0ABP8BXS9_9ACTN